MILCAILVFPPLAGCGDSASSDEAAENKQTAGLRIVTLAPALSQMLVDLGLSDAIVGVAEHENAAPPGLPVVGNYIDVNTELLLSTRPTHVLMMVGPGGAPARLRNLAADGLFELHTFPFPLSVQDIGRVLYDEAPAPGAAPSLGEVLGMPEQAFALKMRMLRQLAGIRALTEPRDKPSVLLVLGTEPLVMASGPGTVHDELLGFAGALNAAAGATVTAPEYDRESLLALAPQVVLLLEPDAPPITEEDPRLSAFAGLPIPAIESGRVYVINHPLVLLPSSSVARICAEMAKAIHPELEDEIGTLMAEQGQAGHD